MGEVFCEDVQTLLSRFQSGDSQAFESLTERFSPLIRHEINRFFSGMDAEEAYVEATEAFHRAALGYAEGHGTTFGLYAKICIQRKMCLLAEKKKKREAALDTETGDAVFDTEGDVIRRDSFSRLLSSVRLLTSDFEYAVLSDYLHGFTEREIAERLSRTEKQIANAKARIFRKLRENAAAFSDIYF